MSREQVVHHSPLLYRVPREEDGTLVIEVVVGGIAMSAVRVRLTHAEAEAFTREGTAFSDRLAKDLMAQPPCGGRPYDAPNQRLVFQTQGSRWRSWPPWALSRFHGAAVRASSPTTPRSPPAVGRWGQGSGCAGCGVTPPVMRGLSRGSA